MTVPVYLSSAAGGSTTNSATTHTAQLSANAGDLWLVFSLSSGNTETAPTCTDDNSSGKYSLIGTALKNSSADTLSVFVRTSLHPGSGTVTVTVTNPAGTTATELIIISISGMNRYGLYAIKQSAFQANQASGGTPAPAFTNAAVTQNITLTCVANGTAGGSVIVPNASWTEAQDVSQSTPTTGIEVAYRNSGFTGTTITQGGTSASAFASCAIEIDTTELVQPTVTYRAAGTGAAVASQQLVVGLPAATAQYDLLLMHYSTRSTGTLPTTLAGWTLAASHTSDTANAAIYWKVAGASEPSTYTWVGLSTNDNTGGEGRVYCYTSPSGVLFDAIGAYGSYAAAPFTVSSVTPNYTGMNVIFTTSSASPTTPFLYTADTQETDGTYYNSAYHKLWPTLDATGSLSVAAGAGSGIGVTLNIYAPNPYKLKAIGQAVNRAGSF